MGVEGRVRFSNKDKALFDSVAEVVQRMTAKRGGSIMTKLYEPYGLWYGIYSNPSYVKALVKANGRVREGVWRAIMEREELARCKQRFYVEGGH